MCDPMLSFAPEKLELGVAVFEFGVEQGQKPLESNACCSVHYSSDKAWCSVLSTLSPTISPPTFPSPPPIGKSGQGITPREWRSYDKIIMQKIGTRSMKKRKCIIKLTVIVRCVGARWRKRHGQDMLRQRNIGKVLRGEAVMEKFSGDMVGGKGGQHWAPCLYHYYSPRCEARIAAGEPVHLGQESFLDLQAAWQRESLLAAMQCHASIAILDSTTP